MTSAEVDRLGERLHKVGTTPADLEQLRAYRRLFRPAYQAVTREIQDQLQAFLTSPLCELGGRERKSTVSIIAKLQRQPTTRLSQIQDIAGCRIVVPTIRAQDAIDGLFLDLKPERTDDRRSGGVSGYRAIHYIVRREGRLVEVQLRTRAQNLWADVSEKLADRFGKQVKYGGEAPGRPIIRKTLDALTEAIRSAESSQEEVDAIISEMESWGIEEEALDDVFENLRRRIVNNELVLSGMVASLAALLDELLK